MEGGVIQQSIEGIGTSDDMSLWLVASFTKFAPEAREIKRQREKQQQQQKKKSMGVLNLQTLSAFYMVNMQTLSAAYPYISF